MIDNKKDALNSINENGGYFTLLNCSDELKNDKEVVMAAMEEYRFSFRVAGEEIRNNKEFILEAMDKCGSILGMVPEPLFNDRDIHNKGIVEEFKYNLKIGKDYKLAFFDAIEKFDVLIKDYKFVKNMCLDELNKDKKLSIDSLINKAKSSVQNTQSKTSPTLDITL
jgi:hypothetical protein